MSRCLLCLVPFSISKFYVAAKKSSLITLFELNENWNMCRYFDINQVQHTSVGCMSCWCWWLLANDKYLTPMKPKVVCTKTWHRIR
jgi:hypothetical protein